MHPLAPQQGSFTSEGERLNIKQEPEDRELTFRSVGLQGITLDDGECWGIYTLPSFSLFHVVRGEVNHMGPA